MRKALAVIILFVSACSVPQLDEVASAARESSVVDEDGAARTVHVGPGVVCGLAFALQLRTGERITTIDRNMDFLIYELETFGQSALLYEGNAPQAADETIKTGEDFPSMIAVHRNDGGYPKTLVDRIVVGQNAKAACAPTAR